MGAMAYGCRRRPGPIDKQSIRGCSRMNVAPATSTFVTAQDGLKLHVCCWGPRTAPALPVVCLPGLARTVADFETLAGALAANAAAGRRVVALDSRGRGKSDYDRKPANYSLQVELGDL